MKILAHPKFINVWFIFIKKGSFAGEGEILR